MKYKKSIILLFFLGVCFFETQGFAKEDETLLESFTVSKTQPIQGHVEVSGNIEERYESRKEKEELLKEIASSLGIKENYSMKHTKEDTIERDALVKYGEDMVFSIDLTDITCADEENQMEQYLFLELKLEEDLDKMLSYREGMCQALKKIGVTPNTNISISSMFEGKYSTEQKDKLTKQLLGYMEASIVEEEKGDETYVVYGYSPRLDDAISYTTEKLNLNITFEYIAEKNQTYLHLAMPYMRCEV